MWLRTLEYVGKVFGGVMGRSHFIQKQTLTLKTSHLTALYVRALFNPSLSSGRKRRFFVASIIALTGIHTQLTPSYIPLHSKSALQQIGVINHEIVSVPTHQATTAPSSFDSLGTQSISFATTMLLADHCFPLNNQLFTPHCNAIRGSPHSLLS